MDGQSFSPWTRFKVEADSADPKWEEAMKDGSFPGKSALVADDDDMVRSTLGRLLRHLDMDVLDAADGGDAIRKVDERPFDLVISDLSMPEADGFAVLASVRKKQPRTPVIILTGAGGVPDSVRAMREGAFDFLTKPFHPTALTEVVRAALAQGGCVGVKPRLMPVNSNPSLAGSGAILLGKSAILQDLLALVQQVGPTDATVLILGETGSGKEVIARLLHASSPRAGQRLVAVNCAAIPENLIESELFGHVKGAFTNAHENRIGRLREADGGTVLLDEIAELALSMQARLLRVLQDQSVTPVGSERSYQISVRFLAATNRDLESMASSGRFRQDLFFRLNVVPIHVPPLRDRLDDVPTLAIHFLEQAARRLDRSITISDKAMAVLQLYGWPGNVRELENLIERMAILDRDGVIDTDDVPPALGGETSEAVARTLWDLSENGVDLPTAVSRFERALIGTAMRRSNSNKSKAAIMLGIGRTTLIDKLRKLGM
ncbi:MAG TPA: sigma-54 dependent transcriptional regulator [Polyangia bacterium]